VFYHRRSARDKFLLQLIKILALIAVGALLLLILWSAFASRLLVGTSDNVPAFGVTIVVNADRSLTITERQSISITSVQPVVLSRTFPSSARSDGGEEIALRFLFTAGSIVAFDPSGARNIQNVTPEVSRLVKAEKVIVSSGHQEMPPGTYVVELEYTVLGIYQELDGIARVRWNLTRNEVQGRFALRLVVFPGAAATTAGIRGQLFEVSVNREGGIDRKILDQLNFSAGDRPFMELERLSSLSTGESLAVELSWPIG